MYRIKLPDFSMISDERKENLRNNVDELYKKYNLGKYIDEEYYPWEKLKYMEIPSEFNSPEELYFLISYLRKGNATPVKSMSWEYFTMNIPPFVQKLLSDLDRKWIELQSDLNFSQSEKNYLSQEWIIEEAISSSQIEWAQTTANQAKEIIMRNREPKNKHEIMIVNNYKAMLFITNEVKDLALSERLLLDLQGIVTQNTLEDEWKSWRYRTDEDNIVVMNGVTWEIYHRPPRVGIMKEEIKKLIEWVHAPDMLDLNILRISKSKAWRCFFVMDFLSLLSALNDFFFMIGFVSNSNIFPEPLSPEEEGKYLKLYENGDEDAKKVLIERNLRLVAHIAKKYNSSYVDQEDIISIGTIGLIKAINSYNNGKGVRLATYAARCIENEILMYFRSTKKTAQEISLNDALRSR